MKRNCRQIWTRRRLGRCCMLPLTTMIIVLSLQGHTVLGFSIGVQMDPSSVTPQSTLSSILPPLHPKRSSQKQRRKAFRKHNNRNAPWEGASIPETIPKLSDFLNRSEPSRSDSPALKKDKRNARKSKQQPTVEPYQAGYYASIKTQTRIKEVAADSFRVPSPADRATRVLETLLATPPQQCNAANVVCALTSSAKLLEREKSMPRRFETLLYQTASILRDMIDQHLLTARQLSNTAWALAKLYDVNPNILPHPNQLVALSSDKFPGHAETWDLEQQSLCRGLDELVDQVAVELRNLLRKNNAGAKVGELAMASWAYGVLRPRRRPPGWKHVPQLDELKDCSMNKDRNSDRTRSNNQFLIRYEAWSMDDSDRTSPSAEPLSVTDNLFDAISDSFLSRDPHHNATRRLESCQWNELATTAWAFANHGYCSSLRAQNLLLAIATESSDRLRNAARSDSVISRDISQLVWALGTLQSDNFRLVDGLLELVGAVEEYTGVGNEVKAQLRPFQAWSCVDIVQILVSMAHARLDEEALLNSLYEEAYIRLLQGIDTKRLPSTRRNKFSSWEISMLLWVQARLHLKEKHGSVFGRFPSRAIKQIVESARQSDSLASIGIGAQEQANLAWSLTVLQAHEYPEGVELLSSVFKEVALASTRDGVIHLEHAHQLWQALFLLEDDCPDAVRDVPQWLYDYLQSKWKAEKARAKVSSARHLALSQTLTLMGVNHVNEHEEDIDVAIVLRPKATWTHEAKQDVADGGVDGSIKVAVEFDGPNHFTRQRQPRQGEQPRPLGQNVLKYRILKKQGWTVVRVPYFEFDKIPFWASMERQRYLQRLLKTHGNLRFSDADISEYKVPVPNRKTRFD